MILWHWAASRREGKRGALTRLWLSEDQAANGTVFAATSRGWAFYYLSQLFANLQSFRKRNLEAMGSMTLTLWLELDAMESKVDIYLYCWCSSWKAILSSLNQVNSLQSDSFNSLDILQEKIFLLQFTQVDQRNIFSTLTMVQHLDSLTKQSFLLTFRLENLGNTLKRLHSYKLLRMLSIQPTINRSKIDWSDFLRSTKFDDTPTCYQITPTDFSNDSVKDCSFRKSLWSK